MKKRRVPSREAWGDLKADPEVRYAHKLFSGKTIEEAAPLFVSNPIERAAELRFSPAPVFAYYVFCFVDFLVSAESTRRRANCTGAAPMRAVLPSCCSTRANFSTSFNRKWSIGP